FRHSRSHWGSLRGWSCSEAEKKSMSDATRPPATPKPTRAHRVFGRLLGAVIVVVAIALTAYVVYYLDTSPRTDDAYARANTIGVAPQVSGRIIALRVRDNQAVKKGDVLFEIDPTPYQHSLTRSRAALDSLEKQIGLSRRDIRAQQLGAEAARANIGKAQAQAEQATDTLNRIEPLLAKEYVTAEQVEQARTAKRATDAQEARLGELRAAVAMGEYDLAQTVVRAPFDGRVTNLDIAEGEFAAT